MSQLTIEEYLESIGALEERENPVSTSSIAQSMGVSLASVSEMLHRLSDKGLVEHTPYSGASLTEEGRKRFVRLTRRHRLWEVFLHRYLGIRWDDVYQHACRLEHATSDIVADKLEDFLGHPKVCPHGSPIPEKNLKHLSVPGTTMDKLEVGESASVINVVVERNPDFLRYLSSLNLMPDTSFEVIEKSPYDGTMTVSIDGVNKAVGREAASLIIVKQK